MSRTRGALWLVVACVLVATIFSGVGTVAGAGVAISNVSVSPQQPQTGELVTFTVTVRNDQSASETYRINQVSLRGQGGTNYVQATDVGNVPPGSELTIPLTTSFEETGVKDLRVVVSGSGVEGSPVLRYPATVVVNDRGTQLAVDVDDPVVGEETEVNVTVSNGGSTAIRGLDLRLRGEGVQVESSRRLAATLGAASDRTFSYDVTFTESGSTSVDAVLEYATTSGQARSVRQTESILVDDLVEDVAIDASIASEGSGTPPIAVDVTNFGNARLDDVSLRVADGDRVVARRAIEPIEPGGGRAVRVNLSGVDRADLDVVLDYETGGRTGQASTSIEYVAQPGRIQLTGVNVERGGSVATISGSASNVGLTRASSVVVEVQPAEGVTPTGPNREFFVGTVPASDFVSFELTARLSGDVSEVPIRVTYIVDGVERSMTATAPVEGSGGPAPTPSGGGGGGGLLVPVLVALVVIAGVGGIIYLGWRNRGGD